MGIHVEQTKLDGVLLITPDHYADPRGFFLESWRQDHFAAAGIATEFVQDNHSRSAQGVLRGFHYQDMTAPMAKLVRCTFGSVWDVVVDLRLGSPTFGQWYAAELSADNFRQLLVPVGYAEGFPRSATGKAQVSIGGKRFAVFVHFVCRHDVYFC